MYRVQSSQVYPPWGRGLDVSQQVESSEHYISREKYPAGTKRRNTESLSGGVSYWVNSFP